MLLFYKFVRNRILHIANSLLLTVAGWCSWTTVFARVIFAFAHFARFCWGCVVCGGVSWGGVGDVIMFAFARARDATLKMVLGHVGSVEMGGAKTLACMWTRT